MDKYVIYLRGINVGGKNKIKMADLRTLLTNSGFENVQTYIQSGNVVLQSDLDPEKTAKSIETLLVNNFNLDSTLVKVLVLKSDIYQSIIEEAEKYFKDAIKAETDHRFDVLYLLGISSDDAMKAVETREGIDTAWQGTHAIYYRRPGPSHEDYTKSALNRLARKDIYQSITIRNWKTTMKMWEMLNSK